MFLLSTKLELFLSSLWAEAVGRLLMLGYQKSSPAHGLYPQTAAYKSLVWTVGARTLLRRRLSLRSYATSYRSQRKHTRPKYSNPTPVARLGYGGWRFLVPQHESAAVPKLRNHLRRKTFTNERTNKQKAPHQETPFIREQSQIN